MSILDDFLRVSKARPCPVCGRPDWCLLDRSNPDDPAVVICQRVESPDIFGEAGFFHRLHGSNRTKARPFLFRPRYVGLSSGSTDLGELAAKYVKAMPSARLKRLESELCVTGRSLERLRVGWDGEGSTFPMSDAKGVVIGIRRRLLDGRKFSVKGGHEGLFLPRDVDASGHLLICEGPTDTAAILDLDLQALGRPSCSGGVRLMGRYLQVHRPATLSVLADRGEHGQRGAEKLAVAMRALCKDVRLITPPEGIGDAREWTRAGATAHDVLRAVEQAEPLALTVETVKGGQS